MEPLPPAEIAVSIGARGLGQVNPWRWRVISMLAVLPLVIALPPAHAQDIIPLDHSVPESLRLFSWAAYEDGKGVDKAGDCEAALDAALADLKKSVGNGTLVAFIDKGKRVTDNAECEVNKKSKATVKLRALSIVPGDDSAYPTVSGTRTVEVAALLMARDMLSASPRANIEAVGGKLYFVYGTHEYQAETLTGDAPSRGGRVFREEAVSGGQLKHWLSAGSAIPELSGTIVTIKDRHATSASENRDEYWRFVLSNEGMAAFAAGTLMLQDLLDASQPMHSDGFSFTDGGYNWTSTKIRVP